MLIDTSRSSKRNKLIVLSRLPNSKVRKLCVIDTLGEALNACGELDRVTFSLPGHLS